MSGEEGKISELENRLVGGKKVQSKSWKRKTWKKKKKEKHAEMCLGDIWDMEIRCKNVLKVQEK